MTSIVLLIRRENGFPIPWFHFPQKAKGTAIMKSKRSLNERMIEQGRKGNIGCYIVSWAFFFALVALAVFGLKSCGVF